jgi:ribosomal protein S18 acetylase RimI-like enzyme
VRLALQPAVEVYLESWGRAGDLGFVAEDASGHRVGAAWYRLFTPDRHGYGFVSQRVPEISIGLELSWRGRGLGRRLLEHLHAGAIGDNIPRLSLAVNAGNLRAVRLYEHLGYVTHGIVGTYHGADGALLHYDVLGESSASPLIVLAGGAARHPGYLGDLAGLSEHHQLVIPHLRGVGRSSAADIGDRGSWWRQADDVERLRVSLGLNRCAVVAHSAGTRLAIAYAAQFPDRLAALLLITPPASYLVDVPSDVSTLAADRMAEPAFAAAVLADDEGQTPAATKHSMRGRTR